MRCSVVLLFVAGSMLASCGGESAAPVDVMKAPLGLEALTMVASEGNPYTREKVELGKHLFFDTRLSSNGQMSCETCHVHEKGWTDGVQFSTKVDGSKNTRNSPTLYNLGYHTHLYWDGRAPSLEANIGAAWKGHMGGKPDEMAQTLAGIAGYKDLFQKAFGAGPTGENIVQALASFVRSLRAGDSDYDRKQLSASAKVGQGIFNTRCVVCHNGALFTDLKFHNAGVGQTEDIGRGKYDESKMGAFKTPTLRNVTKSAPYFHDGSVKTLEEAVTIMAHGGIDNPNLDPLFKINASLDKLTDNQIKQLIEFLTALESREPFTKPTLPK